jgi:hypothetical protein
MRGVAGIVETVAVTTWVPQRPPFPVIEPGRKSPSSEICCSNEERCCSKSTYTERCLRKPTEKS